MWYSDNPDVGEFSQALPRLFFLLSHLFGFYFSYKQINELVWPSVCVSCQILLQKFRLQLLWFGGSVWGADSCSRNLTLYFSGVWNCRSERGDGKSRPRQQWWSWMDDIWGSDALTLSWILTFWAVRHADLRHSPIHLSPTKGGNNVHTLQTKKMQLLKGLGSSGKGHLSLFLLRPSRI